MVEEAWRKKYGNVPYKVGGYYSVTRGYIYQTEDNLIEIKGLTTQAPIIVDLNES